jgi:hypothetical protein
MVVTLMALAALLLLPGLLVGRAPWPAVPALSLAFWALSSWWPAFSGLARGRFVAAALFVAALLLLIRVLPKHEVPPPPGTSPPAPQPRRRSGRPTPRLASAPVAVLLGVALTLLAFACLWHHAPGPRMAFQTTSARLVLWRDGIPLSAEPLLPLAPFGAHAPALATVAADLSALSGSDPARAVVLVFVAASGLLLLGLFMLEAAWLPPWAAVLGALSGLAAAQGLDWLALWGPGEAALCLGLVLPASALVLGHSSRSSAFAAGALLGAGLLAQPLLTLAVWGACATALLWRRGRPGLGRLVSASAAAAALGGPGLVPALRALSLDELPVILSPSARDAAAFLLGSAALLFAVPAGRWLSPPARGARLAVTVPLGLAFGACLVAAVQLPIAAAQLPSASEEALARVARITGPLDAVCAPTPLRDWIPALAGRAPGEPGPWIPAIYRDEWSARVRRRCRASLP